jgi:ABC-2 type transport system ATP-binding protein
LHVRLSNPAQRPQASELVARMVGDGILPASEPGEVVARLENPAQAAGVLFSLTEAGIEVAQFSVGSPSLDEVFLALTGRPAEEPVQEAGA